MNAGQQTLPLGFGQVHWDTLAPEVRTLVLDLWIQLLQDHHARRTEVRPEGERVP